MLLSHQPSAHTFCYARVLGIHTNAIYVGPGLRDYQSHQIRFLWVRWFEVLNCSAGWDHTTLDSVKFPPMAEADAFDFIDPADVLRCCHIIPAFADGQVHLDGIAMSCNARDAADWKWYYVNRCKWFFWPLLRLFWFLICADLLTKTWQCDITGALVLAIHILMVGQVSWCYERTEVHCVGWTSLPVSDGTEGNSLRAAKQ